MSYNPDDPTPKWIQEVGGHECKKHGRYYGTCASCQFDNREREQQTELDRLRRIEAAAKAWLETEDAFLKTMDEATQETWCPGYGDTNWDAVEKAREALRKAIGGE